MIENDPSDTLPITLSVPDNDFVHVQIKNLIILNLDNSGQLSLNHHRGAGKSMFLVLLSTTRGVVMEEEELEQIKIQKPNFGDE